MNVMKLSALALVASALWPAAGMAAPTLSPGNVATPQAAEKVACWFRNGVRRCAGPSYTQRRYGYRVYGYGPSYSYGPSYGYPAYGRPRPEDFRTGSTEWWKAMDLEDRGGFRR